MTSTYISSTQKYLTNASLLSLSDLQIPYEEPKRTSLPLKFRYTTYLGEHHPAAKKVVVEFTPGHLGLSARQRTKFIKLVGARYDPLKNLVRMSCESHESQAQNKRSLGATIAELIRSAKGLGREGDDFFEDVPLDFRYTTVKPKVKFPEAWKLDEKRRAELSAKREEMRALLDVPEKAMEGTKEVAMETVLATPTVSAGERRFR